MNVSKGESSAVNVDIPCPKCGEMVRKGTIRCRECGSFIGADPGQENPEANDIDDFELMDDVEMFQANDADFEIADGVATFEAGESAFEMQLEKAPPAPAEEDYGLTDDPLEEDDAAAGATTAPPEEGGGNAPAAETPPAASPPPGMPNSTGDMLLDSALAEEMETQRRGRGRVVRMDDLVTGQGVVVYCPSGHRIHVADKFRGRTGRCPQCRAPFVVPGTPSAASLLEDEDQGEEEHLDDVPGEITFESEAYGQFKTWMPNVRLHRMILGRLRLREGSLADESEMVDVGFSDDALLVVTVFKGKGGLTAKTAMRKKPLVREKVRDALNDAKKKSEPGDLPAPFSHLIKKEDFEKIWLAQPAPPKGESLFAELDIFGPGVVGLRLPGVEGKDERLYLTFTLSQYREFAKLMKEKFNVEFPAEEHNIPVVDETEELICHYSGRELRALKHLEYYEADPNIKLELIGRQCAQCGIGISEMSRNLEKFGGKNASGIAKAKCPACEAKFGNISLYQIKEESKDKPEAEE